MSIFHQVFASILVLLLVQPYIGEAIRCHNCSHLQEGCDSPPGDKYLIDCNEEPDGIQYKFCRKIDMWVDFKVNDLEPFKRVLRQCAIEEEVGKPCYYKAGLGARVNVCHCKEDGCNHAHTLSVLHSVFILPVMALVIKFL